MQLMADAVGVLGSRHGLVMDPIHRTCAIARFDPWNGLPWMELRAGVVIEGKEFRLPLCDGGERFFFHDQRTSPCTMSLMGIDPASMLRLKLTVVTPFRPRDAVFSTRPVLGLRLSVNKLAGCFRWMPKTSDPATAKIFLEVYGEGFASEPAGADAVDLRFASRPVAGKDGRRIDLPQRDRLVALNGRREGARLVLDVDFAQGLEQALDIAWCTFSAPVLEVQGRTLPFKYTEQAADLNAVAAWARRDGAALFSNAAKVDGIVARNTCSKSVNNLLAQTLHTWLLNTWWASEAGRDVFTVWEGSCHFHSTVDVEFTESPFYLAVWPELLGLELDLWPYYSKNGESVLGERGRGTLFLAHDAGNHIQANAPAYNHDMAVEETTNYVILACAHRKRTGDDGVAQRHAETIEKYLRFIRAGDTTGDGVPDQGVANTVDDASPAVQFGRKQVYLAVKALAALSAGADLMRLTGRRETAAECESGADAIRRTIEAKGWKGDHFATLLDKSAEGIVNPWTKQPLVAAEIPGWDAAHIYTANGLPPLDMVGYDVGIAADRLRTDLRVATARCLREYGCVHSEYEPDAVTGGEEMLGLAGLAKTPGWIAMNLLRDVAAFYRGVDLRHLTDRYWEWQVLTNTQQPALFFETFGGNNLHFYPRGVVVWGFFDALAGLVIDRTTGTDRCERPLPQVRVPRLFDADWANGTCAMIES